MDVGINGNLSRKIITGNGQCYRLDSYGQYIFCRYLLNSRSIPVCGLTGVFVIDYNSICVNAGYITNYESIDISQK